MEIHIKKSWRKTLSLRFDRKWIVQVHAPMFVTQRQINTFIEKHKDWIEKQKEKRKESVLDTSKISLYKQQAKELIIPRVHEYADKYGFVFHAIKITSAMTRWGSCTSKKNLNFTYRLVLAPEFVRDYVIVHELCHLRQMNHSKKFWSEVAKIMPDYKLAEKWLRENGGTIS